MAKQIPVLLTGECFSTFLEVLVQVYQLNINNEKLISDNLIDGQQFNQINVNPATKQFEKLYQNSSKIELSSSRYSMYPQLVNSLEKSIVDIEAYNQFEEPEIISLKNHPFFVASGFCPQISSTRELPHPLVYTFIKACTKILAT